MIEEGITVTIISNGYTSLENGRLDAGGLYGGPTCHECNCTIHSKITTTNPALLLFRWDFDNDGFWDYPLQKCPDSTSDWIDGFEFDHTLYDHHFSAAVVKARDGVSWRTTIITGTNLGEPKHVDCLISTSNMGWRFRAKKNMDVVQLGYWQDVRSYTWLKLMHQCIGWAIGSIPPPRARTLESNMDPPGPTQSVYR